jgi:mRNA-degrading endonuclease RelE of RelBE toxin-antitoxin system
MTMGDRFQDPELASIDAGLTEFARGEVLFQPRVITASVLLGLWTEAEPLTTLGEQVIARKPSVVYERAIPGYAPFREPNWDLGLTHEFRKAIKNIDRRLQGRVLQALDYISSKPTVPRGDTVKPLSGEYEGLWRYRIGDYRLIYRPDTDNARVVLITVVSREAAYA